jgi:hypothetical protein
MGFMQDILKAGSGAWACHIHLLVISACHIRLDTRGSFPYHHTIQMDAF